jgi:hypothetical protein
MSIRSSFVHVVHDLGLAGWFGGSLMGAVGLDPASRAVVDPHDGREMAFAGWARWTPVNAALAAAYLLGARLKGRAAAADTETLSSVRRLRLAQKVLTALALGASCTHRLLGQRLIDADTVARSEGAFDERLCADSGQRPQHPGTLSPVTPDTIVRTQRQMGVLRWLPPALTGVKLVLHAVADAQRPSVTTRAAPRLPVTTRPQRRPSPGVRHGGRP